MQNIVEWEGPPDERRKGMLFRLYEEIFGEPVSPKVLERIVSKPRFLLLFALNEAGEPIGYKAGYAAEPGVFYSWIGGVLPAWRGRGVAQALMQKQHDWCLHNGYTKVRTKTMNRWRNMLLLNIRNGFDVVGTVTGEDGILRIILEKNLLPDPV